MKMTFEVDVPDWAAYLAMDQDGCWCWWEIEPSPIDDHYGESGKWDDPWLSDGNPCGKAYVKPRRVVEVWPVENWDEELYKVIR